MNFVEFHFSSGKTMPVQIEYSNEEIFRIFFRKCSLSDSTINDYIKSAESVIKECKKINIINRDDFNIFQINSIEVLKNIV